MIARTLVKPLASHSNTPQTWIFQASPIKYRIQDSLRAEQEEYWNLRQYAKNVVIGDRVLIWISGQDAGIYAVGKVLTVPQLMSDSSTGMTYWIDQREGRQAKPRVLVHYQRVLDRPLLKVFLKCEPAFWNHKIIKSPRGTNFSVTESEWAAINMWLS